MYKFGAQLHLNNWSKLSIYRNSPAVQWVGLRAFTAESWVQSPVTELRPHKSLSTAKKNQN